jgi:hypothetical protein
MYYAQLPKDNSAISTKQKIEIGTLANVPSGGVLTFSNRVDHAPIPKGANLAINNGQAGLATFESFNTTKSINYSGTLSANSGNKIYAVMSKPEYGDFIRDYYFRIKLTANTSSVWELFAININQHESNLTLNN